MRYNRLIIDLSKIAANYNYIKSITKAEVGAVVKGDAYGLGITPVTQALLKCDCKHFFVTEFDEVSAIRSLSDDVHVYMLHGTTFEEEAFQAHKNKAIPVINSLRQWTVWNNFAKKVRDDLPYILHIDTGLNRLGLMQRDIGEFISATKSLESSTHCIMVMSHLISAHDPKHPQNPEQLNDFQNLTNKYFNNIKTSFSNSGGMFINSHYHCDLLRIGAALYGISPYKEENKNLQNPIRYLTRIIEVYNIPKGQTTGYGGLYTTERNIRCGVVPLGYYDKLPPLSEWKMMVDKYSVNMIGRMGMNLINIDITDLPNELAQVGQEVEAIGDYFTPQEITKLTGINGRFITTLFSHANFREYI